jgi:hypothetical protein
MADAGFIMGIGDAMEEMGDIKVLFIAGFGPIVSEASASRKLYNQILGIGFKRREWRLSSYRGSAGCKNFRSVAAFASSAVLFW